MIKIKSKINVERYGFTLIELLVVITIIGVLATLVITNLNEARARARDVRKKQDLAQLKTALQMYYNSYNQNYPESCNVNTIKGCGADGDSCCPNTSPCPEFAAGGTGCETVFMNKLPTGLGNNTVAYYSDGDTYCIKTDLENASDGDIATSWARCNSACFDLIGHQLLKNQEYAVCPD
jgi:prepilin-type N-terminal cleavage/methylation domain-containing protein